MKITASIVNNGFITASYRTFDVEDKNIFSPDDLFLQRSHMGCCPKGAERDPLVSTRSV